MEVMSAYTCINCRVVFGDAETQRSHYKSDWHRYNLKRKVAELPPVSAEVFHQRVLEQREQVAEVGKDTSEQCKLCKKPFRSRNAYENHLQSKKHKEAESKEEQKRQAIIQKRNEKNEEKGLTVLDENVKVLEKNARNESLREDQNQVNNKDSSKVNQEASGSSSSPVKSKQKAGSSTQDDVEMAEDDDDDDDDWEEGALGMEECLFCSHVSASLEKNIKHMSMSHSFFLPDTEYLSDLEGLISYLGEKVGVGCMCLWCNDRGKAFYSAQAAKNHMVDKGHCRLNREGDALYEYSDYYDYRSSYADADNAEGMEHDGNEDEEAPEPAVLKDDSYELVLPSGNRIGHRELALYYKQNLQGRRVGDRSLVKNVMSHYKAIGWTGTTGDLAKQKVKDLAYMQRLKFNKHMHLGVKANKLQKHFRCQNPI